MFRTILVIQERLFDRFVAIIFPKFIVGHQLTALLESLFGFLAKSTATVTGGEFETICGQFRELAATNTLREL